MRRVAITGVAGYIGSRLLERLDKHPEVEAVIGVDLAQPAVASEKLRFYRRDITAPLDGLFEKEKVDAAVHLAFVVRPVRKAKRAKDTNILGTHNVIRECRLAKVPHVVYLGSTATYGAHRDNPELLTEDSPLRPNARFPYSRDKAETDQMFQSYARGVKETAVTILRGAVVLGPSGARSVGAKMFRRVMVRLAGRDPQMQFLHEEDLMNILVLCLEKQPAGIFNVASDGALPYSQVARLAKRRMIALPRSLLAPAMNIGWALRFQSESTSAGLDFIAHPWVTDNAKLKKALAYEYRYTSGETIKDFAEEEAVRKLAGKSASLTRVGTEKSKRP